MIQASLPPRDEAIALLQKYTSSESLIKHALTVEAGMLWYASFFDKSDEIDLWGLTGLLHDFDYERFPEPVSPHGHPYAGNLILEELGYPKVLREAIMGHATYTGVKRTTLLSKVLFAVDELSGLITATCLVRPDRSIKELEVKSVKKKLKDKAFARGCNRDDIKNGALELGLELDDHIANVITAIKEKALDLGL
jgi:predicted hydrolase (HD superfamily)